MKKPIATLALIFALAPIAQTETVNVFDGGSDDQKVIFRTDDNGETTISTAIKYTDRDYVVFGQDGRITIVNDFSGGDDRDSE